VRSPEVRDPLSQIQANNFQAENLQVVVVLLKKEKEIHQIIPLSQAKDLMTAIKEDPEHLQIAEEKTVLRVRFKEKVIQPPASLLMEIKEAGVSLAKKVRIAEMTEHHDPTREKAHLPQTSRHMGRREAGINPVRTDQIAERTAVQINSLTKEINHTGGMTKKGHLPLPDTAKAHIHPGKKRVVQL
jgi:hypothetical protein